MTCCINGGNVIRLLFLSAKLLKFEIQKCGPILCAHKPYFLMPGHKCCWINLYFIHIDDLSVDEMLIILASCSVLIWPLAN